MDEKMRSKLDKTKLKAILPRIRKEMESTMPKADEMDSFFKEQTIKNRIKAKMGTGTDMPSKSFLMRETEREAFLLEQDATIDRTRKEISKEASDAESRLKVTKRVESLRDERAKRIREWMEMGDGEETGSGSLSGTGNVT